MAYGRIVSLNENSAGVWELHPVVERSTLRRSVVNFQGTSFRWSHRGKTKAAGSVNENPQIPAQGRRGPVFNSRLPRGCHFERIRL